MIFKFTYIREEDEFWIKSMKANIPNDSYWHFNEMDKLIMFLEDHEDIKILWDTNQNPRHQFLH